MCFLNTPTLRGLSQVTQEVIVHIYMCHSQVYITFYLSTFIGEVICIKVVSPWLLNILKHSQQTKNK